MEWEWHVKPYVTICMSPSSCSIHWSGISEFNSSAQFDSNVPNFRKGPVIFGCLREYIKKLPTNARNN